MKKLYNKAKQVVVRKKDVAPTSVPRITNETLAEHREHVIKKGKRYKYPVQYTKNRIVFVSILILSVLIIATVLTTWLQLYKSQTTSTFFYRITQLVPLPVANVDGQPVGYDDYLREMRGALHYLQSQQQISEASDDGKREIDYHRRNNLDKVISQAYAAKIAKQRNIVVSDQEADNAIQGLVDKAVAQGGSRQGVLKSILDYYDWTYGEYKTSVKASLLQKKVTQVIDDSGKKTAEAALTKLKSGVSFNEVAKEFSQDILAAQNGGDFGTVSKLDEDTYGYNNALFQLKKDAFSDVILGNDGFYIIKAVSDDPSARQVQRIFIKYTVFDNQLAQLKKDKKISEYIEVVKN